MTERVCEEKEKRPRLLYNATSRCLDKLDVGLDPGAIATVVCVCVCEEGERCVVERACVQRRMCTGEY